MSWWTKYLGIPFKHGGSDFSGVDCGGLVLLVMREEKGVNIMHEAQNMPFTAKNKHCAISYHIGQYFEQVNEPKEMDVFILLRRGAWNHAGLLLPDNKFIHACEGDQVRVEQRQFSKTELQGFYRLKNA